MLTAAHARTVCALTAAMVGGHATSLLGQSPATISGRVIDSISGMPVTGAEVSLNDGAARVSTESDGRFTIGNLAERAYSVHVTRFGYASSVVNGIHPGGDPLEIVLAAAALRLSEIVVSPGTFSFGGAGPSARQTMTRAEIDAVPQFAEDIFRAVNRLPGLSSGDFSSRFSVRGGRPDETLIRIDGLEIYEPFHMKDFQDGAISIIDSEAIDGVELMTGGYPVRYGNYTSGVFNINTRTPDDDRTRYGFGVSLINARAMAEGTFAEGKGSFFVSGRRGYVDLLLTALGESGLPSPAYHDLLGKVKYQFGEGHWLAVNVLQASDRWTFDAPATTGFADTIATREDARNRYGNRYAWLTYQAAVSDRAVVRTLASAGRVTSGREGGEFYSSDASPLYDITARRDFTVLGVKHDWTVDATSRMAIEAGAEVRRVDTDYATRLTVTQDPDNLYPDLTGFFPVTSRDSLSRKGTTLGAYLATRLRVFEPLTVEIGGRFDRADYTGDRDLSPRVNALLALDERTSLRLAWGVFRQMQSVWEISILDPTQTYYGSERSRQWTANIEHALEDGSLFRVEAYQKSGDRLRPVYRNWKSGIDVFPESNEDRILVTPVTSSSRGIEFYHQRNVSDRLSLRASYAVAQVQESTSSIENVNDPFALSYARTHGAPHDQRHAVNFDATYRPWQTWSMTTAYTFHSGWPTTLQHAEDFALQGGGTQKVIRPDAVYGARLPAYHRLDARFTKRGRFRGGDLRIFLEVSNLTNRANVFGYDYFRAPTTDGSFLLSRDKEQGFIILPSLGVSWTGWR